MIALNKFRCCGSYYSGYNTKYYTKKGSSFLINKSMGAPCFKEISYKFEGYFTKKDCHYVVIVDKASKQRKSFYNTCLFNKKEICWYLSQIKKLYPFKYSIEGEPKDISYNINIDVKGTHLQHLFVLTCVRYLYEYPYNLGLYDALRYIQNNCYGNAVNQKESFFNILTVAFMVFGNALGLGHCTNDSSCRMFYKTPKELKSLLAKDDLLELNSLYKKGDNDINSADFSTIDLYKRMAGVKNFYKTWIEPNFYKERISCLEHNLDEFRKTINQ
jgi:hypothetical protein